MSMMLREYRLCSFALSIAVLLAVPDSGNVAIGVPLPQRISFNRDIRPILSDRCFLCHGPEKQEAGLRLDVRESAIANAIRPGEGSSSELIRRIISNDPDEQMPPPEAHKPKLTEREIELLLRWIDAGAEYERHWAFIPPTRPSLPDESADETGLHPIDSLVSAALNTEGLRPSPSADKRTLIRRLTLDLTGVPPSPKEVHDFLDDSSPDAYETLVDRLLASSGFAENQTRHWLDLARYADTNGYQYDMDRQQWVWRDWVIHAFDTNMPFDQFTIQQMAGDLLPEATDSTRLATGFHRNHPITIEGGVIDEEYRTEYVMERVTTTSTTWMGLTILCARCHDHKYDPFSQREFYSLYAFFNNAPEKGLNGFAPQARIVSPLEMPERKQLEKQLTQLKADLKDHFAGQGDPFGEWEEILKGELVPWSVVQPVTEVSSGGADLKRLEDGSTLLGGTNPPNDTIEITFKSTAAVGLIRLEALTDPSLPNHSVGRAFNGNFVLSEVELEAGSNPDTLKPVPVSSVSASYEQKGYPATGVIDGKPASGWAVDGNTRFEPSTLTLSLGEAIPSGTIIRFRLIYRFGTSHVIGRYRLSTLESDSAVSPEVRAIAELPKEKRSPSELEQLNQFLVGRYGDEKAKAICTRYSSLKARLAEMDARIPPTMILSEMPNPRQTFVLDRGEYHSPITSEVVTPSIPESIGGMPPELPRNRLGLGQWLVSRDNPLTARVVVNRFWAQLFGNGLVETVEDFGAQGSYPSHPELLDWLAVEFMESGWNVKHLFKTIVMSRTYRQTSVAEPELLTRDPRNLLLARGPRFRLDAEVIRDSALSVSGLLDAKPGGPSVFPYHPRGLWLETNNRPGFSSDYPHPDDPFNLYRRSMYTYWKRTVAPPTMSTFDAPDREICVARRSRTNTPLQSFALLHDPQFVEAARVFAEKLIRTGGNTLEDRIVFGFEACTSRQPSDAELDLLTEAFSERLARYRSDPESARKLLAVGHATRDSSIDVAEHAAMTSVARLMLNLSEFVTKE